MQRNYVWTNINWGDEFLATNRPLGLTVHGTITLFMISNNLVLPNDLVILGSLIVSFTTIYELPKNLTVLDTVDLTGCPIEEIPEGFSVGGELRITHTRIKGFPSWFKIDSSKIKGRFVQSVL